MRKAASFVKKNCVLYKGVMWTDFFYIYRDRGKKKLLTFNILLFMLQTDVTPQAAQAKDNLGTPPTRDNLGTPRTRTVPGPRQKKITNL
jgi:hypothetical protein